MMKHASCGGMLKRRPEPMLYQCQRCKQLLDMSSGPRHSTGHSAKKPSLSQIERERQE
jgi:uncharacterized protein YlaI